MTSFGPRQTIPNALAQFVTTADIDGDGDPDLLTTRFDGNTSWYANNGSGSFGSQQVIAASAITSLTNGSPLNIADVDGDGDLDVLLLDSGSNIAWYANNGSGSFSFQQTISTAVGGFYSVITADVDGDGDLDALSTSSYYDNNTIAWYANNGSGSFGPRQVISTASFNPYAITTADVDGDGDLDLLSGARNTLAWYANNGSGSFGPQQVIDNAGAVCVISADVDGDGDIDFLAGDGWYANNGSGSFGPRQNIDAAGARSIATADVDGDGDLDFLSATGINGNTGWYANNGSGSFGPRQIISPFRLADSVTTADVDGDGDPDAIATYIDFNTSPVFGVGWYENLNAPTDLALSNSTVAENSPVGTVIGNFSTTDRDSTSGFTYSLVSGTGDTGNAAFTIAGNQLKLAVSPNFETQSSYSIRVRTTDPDGLTYQEALTISISDVVENTAPTATGETVSTSQNAPVTVELGDNVADAEGLTGATLSVISTASGTVTGIDQNARLMTFTPTTDFSGTASFKYIITDAGGLPSNQAIVTVEVGSTLSTGNKDQDIQGSAGNDYISGGNGKDRVQGFAGNDTLLGNNGVDTLDGGLGADILTGGNGPDTFVLNSLNESPLSGFDRITDFAIGTDSLDAPTSVSAANLAELGAVGSLTESGIAAVLTGASFAANGAATFSFGSRTFLAINNSTAGFSAATDAVIEITGFSGNLTNLAIV